MNVKTAFNSEVVLSCSNIFSHAAEDVFVQVWKTKQAALQLAIINMQLLYLH